MKCNKGTDLVCTCWEKCKLASVCDNVPIGIKNKLKVKAFNLQLIKRSKKAIILKPKRVKEKAR